MAGQGGGDGLRFAILGPVRAWRDGQELDLGTPLQRSILAMLLIRAGRVVTPEEIIDGVWGEGAPPRALGALRTYVSRLRGVLEPGRSPRSRPQLLTSVGRGYALRLAEGALDLAEFERLVTDAESWRRDGRLAEAAETLRTALGLWAGEPLTGAVGPFAENQRERLAERRMTVVENLVDLDLGLGRHADLVAELRALTGEHPLRERLRAQLMLAYYRCGRQAEALNVFTETRRVLVEELGVEPGPELATLHRRILAGDPTLMAPSRAQVPDPRTPADGAQEGTPDDAQDGGNEAASPAARSDGPAVPDAPSAPATAHQVAPARTAEPPRPAQLPPAVADFTGRKKLVNRLCALLTDPATPEAVPIAAISGIGGVGKTTLAVHVAHLVQDRFPDGQLYADLRGYGEDPIAPETVLAAFLRGLGVPMDVIPEGTAERAALYRSLLADRRILVLLDNARDAEQVTPLLPGAPGCAAIVTGRVKFADLPAARLVDLDVMEPDEALDLFAAVAGPDRVAAERAAAMDVVAACGFLPLAVRIVAARLAARPAWTIASIVPRLADERRRLDELRVGNLAVSATFALGYGQLDERQARAFRLLSLPSGPAISVLAAAAMLGHDPVETEHVLESLVDASLLEAPAPGRYRFHDLLKLFARRQAERTEDVAETARALRRLLDFYLASAQAAHRLAYEGSLMADRLSKPAVPGRTFSSADEAVAWLAVEGEDMFAAIGQAVGEPGDGPVPLLTAADLLVAMEPLLETGTYAREFDRRARAVLAAARAAGDAASELRCRYVLARVRFGANRLDEAEQEFRRALDLTEATGDPVLTGEILNGLGVVAGRKRRHEEALDWFDAALKVYRSTGVPAGEALVLSYSARDHLGLGNPEAAIAAAERGLAIFTELGSGAGMARARYHLGIVLSRVGRFTEAVVHHAECLEFFRASRQRVWEQRVCCRLAETFVAAGRHADAARHAEQALAVSREIAHPYGEAQSLAVLGKALAGLGRTERSAECLRAAHDIFRRLGAPEADDLRPLLERNGVGS
ncbi:regulatory protein AfsR [Thermopolyspora flexuosa]|uniref:DNA-binding SARP family transcriptional activator n=1 Tax=Thermopolyspora flexuosa TaxID=103836 RepID=A0A543IPZ1_9ACTN|nr:BTAD domain-containing putative transcriptional regulator [Thermopolyspora flexuosa]TQM72642.1 DNA-binding SARP family transcriptional activator [Thermopolyspora flexuosa]GGM68980.1 regulatory protein AfsR [Thermopolyspora flexuosa]